MPVPWKDAQEIALAEILKTGLAHLGRSDAHCAEVEETIGEILAKGFPIDVGLVDGVLCYRIAPDFREPPPEVEP